MEAARPRQHRSDRSDQRRAFPMDRQASAGPARSLSAPLRHLAPGRSARSDSMSRREKPKPQVDPLWYKDAVIYQLHVKSFMDSNGDGIGDFKGLISRLDHVVELGANTI